jgi:hydroxyethylthiazole kinase-like uncharacterized protein yjeF
VIDALLGLGLRNQPEGEFALAIQQLAEHPGLRLALDLPSGLDADTGADLGAARCDHSLCFLGLPAGPFTGAGRQLAGTIWHDDLCGDPNKPRSDAMPSPWPDQPAAWLRGAEALSAWPTQGARGRWPHQGHKGLQGDVLVLAGSLPGAAQLAAQAALAAGAGRVYLQGGEPNTQAELMKAPSALPWERSSVVAGCGWTDEREDLLLRCLEQAPRLVLDAGALNLLARSSPLQQQLAQRSRLGQHTIITPHPLEAARLLGKETAHIQAERLACAQALSERLCCITLLKGSGTVVAGPGRIPVINSTGHAALASPGTGDVLAGWLAGLWAQAPEQAPEQLAFLAAAWHGAAADTAPVGAGPLVASQLIQRMAALHPALKAR